MKTILFFSVFTIILSTSIPNLDSNVPDINAEEEVLLENNDILFYLSDKEDLSKFVTVEYIKEDKDIYIETKQEVSYLQVKEVDGKPLYKLPVNTKKLHISSSTLTRGKYAIQMKLKNEKKYIQTILKKS